MAIGKLISFWSDKPGVGRRKLAHALAQHWTDEGRHVLLIRQAPSDHPEISEWIPRFRSLSPTLLRNFLGGSSGSYGRLHAAAFHDAALLNELLDLTLKAYDWVISTAPNELSAPALPILD